MTRFSLIFLTIFTLLFSKPISTQSKYSFSSHASRSNLFSKNGIQLVQSDASGVKLSFNVPAYVIASSLKESGNVQEIQIEGAGQVADAGKPALPVYSVVVGLPAGAEVQLQIITDISEKIPGQYEIAPSPRADFLQSGDTGGKFIFDRDDAVYQHDSYFPSVPVEISDDAWLRDQRLVQVSFYPFQYNPKTGSLLLHKEMDVEIHFLGGFRYESSEVNKHIDKSFDALYASTLINYDAARAWRGIPQNEIYQPVATNNLSHTLTYDPEFLGPRYKIVVDHDGIYQISYEELEAIHPLGVNELDTFHLYNQGRDVALYLEDGGDGIFGSGDAIFFYGERFRGNYMAQRYVSEASNWITLTQQLTDGSLTPWRPEFNHFMLEKYTDLNVYWLTVGDDGGLNMASVNGDPTGSTAPIPLTYSESVHAERELRHWEQSFTSEDTWFWDYVTDYDTHIYTTTLTGIAPGSYTATIQGEVAAYSYHADFSPDHHTRFEMNDSLTPVDDAYWDGKSRYHFWGQVPQSSLLEGENQLKFTNINDSYSFPMIVFDFFEVSYTRLFQAEQDKIRFSGDIPGTWRYRIGGFSTSNLTVFDVTNPISPVRVLDPNIVFVDDAYLITFLASHEADQNYFVTGNNESPLNLSYYDPPDFSAMGAGVDYIFITHPDLITSTQVLNDYRANQDLSTMLVNVEDLYAEFNDGIFHPIAIKNFLGYTFSHWDQPPTYILLIGDGSWHMKQTNPERYGTAKTFMPPNLSWVDPWLGQTDSSNLLAAVVGSDILADVLIGRLPVSSNTELDDIISKIISFEGSSNLSWQRNLLFIADDTPDPAGDFVLQSEGIINEFVRPGFNALRIYLDDYKDTGLCGSQPFPYGPTCVPVNRAITETLTITGTMFVNYTGHGGSQFWTSDKILLYQVENPSIPNDYTINDIASIENGDKLPIVLSMTCWDGYWFYPSAHPAQPSLSELWLKTEGRGAVAVFAAAGLGVENGHYALQEGFYEAVFDNGIWDLGTATLAGKLKVYQYGAYYDLISTYVTFGDPALKIPNPYQVSVEPNAREGSVLPGGSISYSFQVTNESTLTDTAVISVMNSVWSASYPIIVGPIPAGGTETFNVTIHIPQDADGGITDIASLVVASMGDRKKIGTSTIITHSQIQSGVQVNPTTAEQYGLPGNDVTFNLQVLNTGNTSDSYVIMKSSSQWSVSAPGIIGPVDRNQYISLPVTVSIPEDVQDWDSDSVVLNIYSLSDPDQMATTQITTVARTYGVSISPPISSIEASQGVSVSYPLTVENVSEYSDTFSITIDSQWTTEITPTILGPLNPGQTAQVFATVDIPVGLPGGSYDEAIVTAISVGDPAQTDQALLRTIGLINGLEVIPAYTTKVSLPGSTVTYTLQIVNTSNAVDSFNVSIGEHTWPVFLSNDVVGPLAANGGTANITVSVEVPGNTPDWSSDMLILNVVSQTVPDRTAISTIKTIARFYKVTLSPSQVGGEGVPGESLIYLLKVTNTGGFHDSYNVSASSLWPIEVSPSYVGSLMPESTQEITVTIQIPSNAQDTVEQATVMVTSQTSPNVSDQAIVTTTSKLFGVIIDKNLLYQKGFAGDRVTYELELTNTSNHVDAFTIHISSPWQVSVDPVWIGSLAPHASTTFTVVVSIPIDANRFTNSETFVVVRSLSDQSKQSVALLMTGVEGFSLKLPLVTK